MTITYRLKVIYFDIIHICGFSIQGFSYTCKMAAQQTFFTSSKFIIEALENGATYSNQRFPVRVRLIAMWRGELFAVIAQLMSNVC